MPLRKNILMGLFYAGFIVILGIMIVLSLSKPQNNLICWQETIISGFMAIMLIVFGICLEKFCRYIERSKLKMLTMLILLVFFVSLYAVGCVTRNSAGSLVDYGTLYQSAIEMAEEGRITDVCYYHTYSNNIIPMLFLYRLVSLSKMLRMEDSYYLILLTGVIISAAAICASLYLLGDHKEKCWQRFLLIALYAAFIPLWIITPTLYTDQMSFCTAVLTFSLLKAAGECKKKTIKAICCILAGTVLAQGIFVKITVLIPVIAGAVAYMFVKGSRRQIGKYFFVWLAAFAISAAGISLWSNTKEIVREAQETSDPAITWIGLGMLEDGSYGSNMDYISEVHALSTKREKEEYVKQYIYNNRSQFFDLEHLAAKIRHNYASGYLGTKDYIYFAAPGYEDHFLWELCAPFGKYYWRGSQYTFGFIFGIYHLYFAGGMICIKRIVKKGEIDIMLLLTDIAFVGYFLFLLIWEANNRQLYNFMPLLLLGAVLHIDQIVEEWKLFRKK